MKINILSWNTAMYTYENKLKYRRIKPINNSINSSILDYIYDFLNKHENAIAILQEIPFVSNLSWKTHPFFNDLINKFYTDFDIKYNIQSNRQNLMTVIIAAKNLISGNCSYIKKLNTHRNRFFPFIINSTNISILGVHRPLKIADLRKIISDDLVPDFIIGDLNVGLYQKKNNNNIIEFMKNRNNYRNFLSNYNYKQLGNNQPTTVYNTVIDHVLIKKDLCTSGKIRNISFSIDYSIALSDHYPILCSFEI